jgi:CubicO group peptidase (beta-lactamase class C family)
MFDRREFLMVGASGFAQIGQHAQPRVTAPQLLRQAHIPAIGSAVITPKGAPLISVLGHRRGEGGSAVQADDVWLIGANTQAMTAALYAKLVEDNRANWRTRLPELFSDLKIDPAWSDVTIEDLLTHKAGISDAPVATAEFLSAAAADTRPLTVQRTAFAQLILSQPPASEPGRFAYASAGYVLVGAAIERAARMSWETAISAELFTPLGLTSAGFGAPTGPEPWGHQILGPKVMPVSPTGIADDPAVFGPAARVHLSLADYAAFVRLFLIGGGDYLTEDSLRRLVNPRSDSGDGPALGWMVSSERGWAKGPVLSARTASGFWSANVAIGPARGVAVIAVCNAGGEQAGGAATERMMLTLLQQYAPVTR